MTPDELPDALVALADRLAASDARDEVVAHYVVPRTLGIPRAPRLAPIGRAWRLGVLLLMRDGASGSRLRSVGTVIRVEEPAHSALRSRVAEDRLALQNAAARARLAHGAIVDVDTAPIPDATTAPLVVRGGEVLVRWAPSSAVEPRPLGAYLDEEAALLIDPPAGA